MPRRSPGSVEQPQSHWADAKAERAQSDADDLQRLIRYVERWRMAHFQTPDKGSSARMSGDRRIGDADEVLQKLRTGLSVAAAEASSALRAGGRGSQHAFLY